jgi:hypothetical protein
MKQTFCFGGSAMMLSFREEDETDFLFRRKDFALSKKIARDKKKGMGSIVASYPQFVTGQEVLHLSKERERYGYIYI